MKERVLGKTYELSLVSANDRETKALNLRYRKKSYVPNVLSFPIGKQTGEIVLNLGEARRQCRSREESFRFFVALLFIHSMLHLKEYRHGSTMEKQEQKLLSEFHIKNTFRP
jgi:rRNA maturation RNase YbeY